METISLLKKFYDSFQEGNAEKMNSCYSKNVCFSDPAFGELRGDRARAMWKMLLSKDGKAIITYEIKEAQPESGTVLWKASYPYGPNKRPVVNHVNATFKINNGLITEHRDQFDLWKWSRQALGVSGWLLGWSGFMKNKIQQQTNRMLDKYSSTQEN